MAHTPAERSRASRIRRKVKSGTATIVDMNWLDNYEADRGPTANRVDPNPPGRADRDPGAGAGQIARDEDYQGPGSDGFSVPKFGDLPARPLAAVPDDFGDELGASPDHVTRDAAHVRPVPAPPVATVPIPFGPNVYEPGPDPERVRCEIDNCPACKAAAIPASGVICVSTGKRVWPPMSKAGARVMAGVILSAVGMAIKLFRKDKYYVTPSAAEVEGFAEALREVASRRVSWIGAIDDLLALAGAFGRYSIRASTAKKPKDERDDS